MTARTICPRVALVAGAWATGVNCTVALAGCGDVSAAVASVVSLVAAASPAAFGVSESVEVLEAGAA